MDASINPYSSCVVPTGRPGFLSSNFGLSNFGDLVFCQNICQCFHNTCQSLPNYLPIFAITIRRFSWLLPNSVSVITCQIKMLNLYLNNSNFVFKSLTITIQIIEIVIYIIEIVIEIIENLHDPSPMGCRQQVGRARQLWCRTCAIFQIEQNQEK